MNNIISLHKNCNLETTFNLDTGELINSTTACGGDLQPPTTFYTIESNVLNITDTNGSENGVPCGSFLVQELQFSADNISYPLVVPFGGTTYDLCGLDISLLGLPTGQSTIYIKELCRIAAVQQYLDKADIMVTQYVGVFNNQSNINIRCYTARTYSEAISNTNSLEAYIAVASAAHN
ncbi:MAG: hypothetical protein IPK62_16970 [Bacteroidetes bacterium]|nr:hypothetical protein [Bacteroidota bacterium]